MSFLSKLIIDDKESTVLDCSLTIEQESDHNGRPVAKPVGGTIAILLEASYATKGFANWAMSPTLTKDGVIIFYKQDALSIEQKIEFKEAYCLKYTPHFTSEGTMPRQLQIIISARVIKIDDAELENNWPKAQ